MKLNAVHKPILIVCVSASIALHAAAAWYIYSHPLAFDGKEPMAKLTSSPVHKIIPKEEADLLVERMEKALEESLNTIIAVSQRKESEADIALEESFQEEYEQPQIIETTPPLPVKHEQAPPAKIEGPTAIPPIQNEFAASLPPLFNPDQELAHLVLNDEYEEEVAAPENEKVASVDFSATPLAEPTAAKMIEDDYTMTDQQFSPNALPTHREGKLDRDFLSSIQRLSTPHAEGNQPEEKMFEHIQDATAPELILPNTVDYLRSQWVKQSFAESKLPDLKEYGLDEIAKIMEWEERLDVDVQLMALPGENNYVFSLTVHPDIDVTTQSLQQNFYFLVDRSSSIEGPKFNRFKRAVSRSLAALNEGDQFNIYLFDKEITKLTSDLTPVTPKSIEQAEQFLTEQNAKVHFAAAELYTSIEKILPTQFDPNQLHSIILLTDGNTSLTSKRQRSALWQWIKKYEGKVNFYTAAAGKGNNLVLLDLLSHMTAGKMLYSDTNAAFPRKLVHFIKDLHYPILKDLNIEVSAKDGSANLNLYPGRKQLLPPMFSGQPYEIVGTVDELCDLTLFIQGKCGDKWVNFRKKISLKDVITGSKSLEKTWAHIQSKMCYDQYLNDGREALLERAVQIVTPHKGTISLEQ